MMPKMAWAPFNGRYVSGERLKAGQVTLADAAFTSMRPRNDPKCYQAVVALPSLKVKVFRGETMEAVKGQAERAVRGWFNAVLAGDAEPA